MDAGERTRMAQALSGQKPGFDDMPPLGDPIGFSPDGRLIFLNSDNSFSTERSATEIDPETGRVYNFPTIVHGNQLSPFEAMDAMRANGWTDPDTGRELESYSSIDEAEKAAQARSRSFDSTLGPLVEALMQKRRSAP